MDQATTTLSASSIPSRKLLHRGKVRDVYEIDDDRLLIVATDRLSAFDCILPTLIEQKGAILTALSVFWFQLLAPVVENHLTTSDFREMPPDIADHPELAGRTMLVKRTEVFPVECVVRGYLEGSGWNDYMATGEVCGHKLPTGLRQCDKLPKPLFTPSTKAAEGHDANISEQEFTRIVGGEAAETLRSKALEIYTTAAKYAASKGIIIADTKFEFGRNRTGNVILIDEVLTPDSSRFWPAESYEPGHAQPSFDKQYVREYLETLDWNKQPPAPPLPRSVAKATTERYKEAYRILTHHEI